MKGVSDGMMYVFILAILLFFAWQSSNQPNEVAALPSFTQVECANVYQTEFQPAWSKMNKLQRGIVGLQASSDCVDGSR